MSESFDKLKAQKDAILAKQRNKVEQEIRESIMSEQISVGNCPTCGAFPVQHIREGGDGEMRMRFIPARNANEINIAPETVGDGSMWKASRGNKTGHGKTPQIALRNLESTEGLGDF